MDIEQLSKSQIMLLTLLVSFVTSIATGIVTVSLMDQAPPVVAQTVNRIVEHTVETVAPPPKEGQSAATVLTQEKTVVVNESEQVASAVAKITPSVVRLSAGADGSSSFAGLGVVLSSSGLIAADAAAIGENADATVTLSDGTTVRAFVVHRDTAHDIAILQAATSSDSSVTWTPAGLSAEAPSLGKAVVLMAGKADPRISDGLVTALPKGDAGDLLETNLSRDDILPGSPIIDVDGSVVGMSTGASRTASPTAFIPAKALAASATAPQN